MLFNGYESISDCISLAAVSRERGTLAAQNCQNDEDECLKLGIMPLSSLLSLPLSLSLSLSLSLYSNELRAATTLRSLTKPWIFRPVLAAGRYLAFAQPGDRKRKLVGERPGRSLIFMAARRTMRQSRAGVAKSPVDKFPVIRAFRNSTAG